MTGDAGLAMKLIASQPGDVPYLGEDEFSQYVGKATESLTTGELWSYWEDGLIVPLATLAYPESYVRWCAKERNLARFHPDQVLAIPQRHRRLARFEESLLKADYASDEAALGHVTDALERAFDTHPSIARRLSRVARPPERPQRTVAIKGREGHRSTSPRVLPHWGPWQLHEVLAVRWEHYVAVYSPRARPSESSRRRVTRRSHLRFSGRQSKPGDVLGLRRSMIAFSRWRRALSLADRTLIHHERRLSGGLVQRDAATVERVRQYLRGEARQLHRYHLGPAQAVKLVQDFVLLHDWYQSHEMGRMARVAREDAATGVQLLQVGYGMEWQEALDRVGTVGRRVPALARLFDDEHYRVVVDHGYLFNWLADETSSTEADVGAFLRHLSTAGLGPAPISWTG